MKSHHFVTLLDDKRNINYIFDTSITKSGKFINKLDIPIKLPDNEAINYCDVIVIFASGYNKEIIETLEKKYNFSGDIIYYDNKFILSNKV